MDTRTRLNRKTKKKQRHELARARRRDHVNRHGYTQGAGYLHDPGPLATSAAIALASLLARR